VLSAPRYIEDGDEIIKYFAAFHLLDNFPAAVIVDDFADFFSERCNFCLVMLMTFVYINCELHAILPWHASLIQHLLHKHLIGSNLEMPFLCSSRQT
jgi:hypothetical protein